MITNAVILSSLILGTLMSCMQDIDKTIHWLVLLSCVYTRNQRQCIVLSLSCIHDNGGQKVKNPCNSMPVACPGFWSRGQVYEDKRCRCVCPSPAAVLNSTLSPQRKLYIADVPPNKCNCVEVVLPRLGEIKGREAEYCPRCECKYETRNTTVIKVVVISVVWLTGLLLVYAGFLACLRPLMRRKRTYKDHSTEEARSLMQCYDEED